ncbi:NADH:flavin oxidoreductase/NADH oxidase family protein [Deltaproteobacteria bacterium TL4]
MNQASVLDKELTLPCGAKVNNRFMKSAMSEVLGAPNYAPTPALEKLYKRWSEGGAGLLVTGNVMVDARYLGEPGNVVIEDEQHFSELKRWASAGTVNGNHLWMQINHPGKQVPNILSREPVAPSAIPLKLPMFNKPRALTHDEILEIIERFGTTAAIAKKSGFTGVQIHGAHGYLVSQFLSPHHNQRQDQWGGSIQNRMRFLSEIYRTIRNAVGTDYPVGLKLNSADFQRGGFTEEESFQVIETISNAGIDLIEISGGTYEVPAMMNGNQVAESTRQREAYFLSFAEKIRKVVPVPIAVTGGFRTASGMMHAVESGATDLVGLARPFALTPDLPNRVLQGENFQSPVNAQITTGFRMLDKAFMLDLTWYEQQFALMAKGKDPDTDLNPWMAAASAMLSLNWRNLRRRRA